MPRSPRACGGQPTALPARMPARKVVWNSIITGASRVEKPVSSRKLIREAAAEAARAARGHVAQRQGQQLGAEQQGEGEPEQAVDLGPMILRPQREQRARRPEIDV